MSSENGGSKIRIYVDADACPVKEEVYRVATRFGLSVILVANAPMRIRSEDWLELVVVGPRFDESDDWIVEHVLSDDIVITADIPLAARCLKKGALVLGHKGKEFTENNIGSALVTRDLMAHMREGRDSRGEFRGGPPPFEKKDRSRFLQSLDAMIQALGRKGRDGRKSSSSIMTAPEATADASAQLE